MKIIDLKKVFNVEDIQIPNDYVLIELGTLEEMYKLNDKSYLLQ